MVCVGLDGFAINIVSMPRLVQIFQLRINISNRYWAKDFLQRNGARLLLRTMNQVCLNADLVDRTRMRSLLIDCMLNLCDACVLPVEPPVADATFSVSGKPQ